MKKDPPWGQVARRMNVDQRVILILFVLGLLILFVVIFIWIKPFPQQN